MSGTEVGGASVAAASHIAAISMLSVSAED
jgi:hypothetical protein